MSDLTTGSTDNMLARLKAAVPARWFPDLTPVLDGLLTGLAGTSAALYGMLSYVRQQCRISTTSSSFLDLAASDFCGQRISRRTGESDAAFRARLARELLRERGTLAAVVGTLGDLTGRTPFVFEPSRPEQSGGYGVASGYGISGALGSLNMPFQSLVVAYRPSAGGSWTGGSGPGAPIAGAAPVIEGHVTDAEIFAAVADVAPVAATIWTAISN